MKPRQHPSPSKPARALPAIMLAMLVGAMPLAPASAQAQGAAPASAPALACTRPHEMTPAHLYGLWQLSLLPMGDAAAEPVSKGALLFERHPEYPGSVRGSLTRSSADQDRKAVVSGDVTNGEFNLDESADGQTMDAVWTGDITPAGCGQEIRGVRRPATGKEGAEPELRFVLKKAPGWR